MSKKQTLFGIELKWISLITLVVQNSVLVIVMRYSRTIPGPRYNTATAVVVSEFIKLIASLIIHIREESRIKKITPQSIFMDVFGPTSGWMAMTVPAILYFIQNNLQYVAVSKLDAATFQVTYQLKILTTALFSVGMLKRTLSLKKWVSLVLLTAGVAIVQLSSQNTAGNNENQDKFWGLVAVMCACMFEKVLKGSQSSLFLKNVQLAFFSAIPGLIFGVYIANGAEIRENGFFYGYNVWTWGAIACQALGGIIVAIVVLYADNILKGFATSISIILSSLMSVVIFDIEITFAFVVGAIVVLYGIILLTIATHLYGQPDVKKPILPEYIRVEDDNKA
ncbi:hypothetical protein HK103_000122 [Boothiomyces macroporosus]|uniref:UDP-galactose transporter n=1 Tax=Boothiomyces macroporosus TaxID=261099 RepID=A0AAD5UPX3_9FUNG|nr:hypothetical protein HK103_000122 [Boothiomyces macroporosus]